MSSTGSFLMKSVRTLIGLRESFLTKDSENFSSFSLHFQQFRASYMKEFDQLKASLLADLTTKDPSLENKLKIIQNNEKLKKLNGFLYENEFFSLVLDEISSTLDIKLMIFLILNEFLSFSVPNDSNLSLPTDFSRSFLRLERILEKISLFSSLNIMNNSILVDLFFTFFIFFIIFWSHFPSISSQELSQEVEFSSSLPLQSLSPLLTLVHSKLISPVIEATHEDTKALAKFISLCCKNFFHVSLALKEHLQSLQTLIERFNQSVPHSKDSDSKPLSVKNKEISKREGEFFVIFYRLKFFWIFLSGLMDLLVKSSSIFLLGGQYVSVILKKIGQLLSIAGCLSLDNLSTDILKSCGDKELLLLFSTLKNQDDREVERKISVSSFMSLPVLSFPFLCIGTSECFLSCLKVMIKKFSILLRESMEALIEKKLEEEKPKKEGEKKEIVEIFITKVIVNDVVESLSSLSLLFLHRNYFLFLNNPTLFLPDSSSSSSSSMTPSKRSRKNLPYFSVLFDYLHSLILSSQLIFDLDNFLYYFEGSNQTQQVASKENFRIFYFKRNHEYATRLEKISSFLIYSVSMIGSIFVLNNYYRLINENDSIFLLSSYTSTLFTSFKSNYLVFQNPLTLQLEELVQESSSHFEFYSFFLCHLRKSLNNFNNSFSFSDHFSSFFNPNKLEMIQFVGNQWVSSCFWTTEFSIKKSKMNRLIKTQENKEDSSASVSASVSASSTPTPASGNNQDNHIKNLLQCSNDHQMVSMLLTVENFLFFLTKMKRTKTCHLSYLISLLQSHVNLILDSISSFLSMNIKSLSSSSSSPPSSPSTFLSINDCFHYYFHYLLHTKLLNLQFQYYYDNSSKKNRFLLSEIYNCIYLNEKIIDSYLKKTFSKYFPSSLSKSFNNINKLIEDGYRKSCYYYHINHSVVNSSNTMSYISPPIFLTQSLLLFLSNSSILLSFLSLNGMMKEQEKIIKYSLKVNDLFVNKLNFSPSYNPFSIFITESSYSLSNSLLFYQIYCTYYNLEARMDYFPTTNSKENTVKNSFQFPHSIFQFLSNFLSLSKSSLNSLVLEPQMKEYYSVTKQIITNLNSFHSNNLSPLGQFVSDSEINVVKNKVDVFDENGFLPLKPWLYLILSKLEWYCMSEASSANTHIKFSLSYSNHSLYIYNTKKSTQDSLSTPLDSKSNDEIDFVDEEDVSKDFSIKPAFFSTLMKFESMMMAVHFYEWIGRISRSIDYLSETTALIQNINSEDSITTSMNNLTPSTLVSVFSSLNMMYFVHCLHFYVRIKSTKLKDFINTIIVILSCFNAHEKNFSLNETSSSSYLINRLELLKKSVEFTKIVIQEDLNNINSEIISRINQHSLVISFNFLNILWSKKNLTVFSGLLAIKKYEYFFDNVLSSTIDIKSIEDVDISLTKNYLTETILPQLSSDFQLVFKEFLQLHSSGCLSIDSQRQLRIRLSTFLLLNLTNNKNYDQQILNFFNKYLFILSCSSCLISNEISSTISSSASSSSSLTLFYTQEALLINEAIHGDLFSINEIEAKLIYFLSLHHTNSSENISNFPASLSFFNIDDNYFHIGTFSPIGPKYQLFIKNLCNEDIKEMKIESHDQSKDQDPEVFNIESFLSNWEKLILHNNKSLDLKSFAEKYIIVKSNDQTEKISEGSSVESSLEEDSTSQPTPSEFSKLGISSSLLNDSDLKSKWWKQRSKINQRFEEYLNTFEENMLSKEGLDILINFHKEEVHSNFSLNFSKESKETTTSKKEIVNFSELKIVELRELCKKNELNSFGTREVLITRLEDNLRRKNNFIEILEDNSCEEKEDTEELFLRYLLLPSKLHSLPIESCPSLKSLAFSRLPSLTWALSLSSIYETNNIKKAKVEEELKSNHQPLNLLSSSKVWYAIDIDGDLPSTRTTMSPFLKDLSEKFNWGVKKLSLKSSTFNKQSFNDDQLLKNYNGIVGYIPPKEIISTLNSNSDLFIYCGHGAADKLFSSSLLASSTNKNPLGLLLWGCSSGKLNSRGFHDPSGPLLQYTKVNTSQSDSTSQSEPNSTCIVASLWDVTDKDLDRFSLRCMEQLFDEKLSKKNISHCVIEARDACKMKYAVGSSIIVYGIPFKLNFSN